MRTGIISIFTPVIWKGMIRFIIERGVKKHTWRRSWEDLLSIVAPTSAEKSHLRNNDKTWVFDKSKRVQGAIYVINCDKTLRTFDNTRECKKHDPHFPCVLKYS